MFIKYTRDGNSVKFYIYYQKLKIKTLSRLTSCLGLMERASSEAALDIDPF